MTTPRDPDGQILAFLAEGQNDLPDRTYDAIRSEIDRTRQRVVIGPWREPRMNSIAKIAIAAAAVVIVAVVGINLMPGSGGITGGVAATASPSPSPTATPSPTPAPTPTPLPTATPPPTAPPRVLPPTGALAIGRHELTTNGTPFTLELTTPDWNSGEYGFDRGGNVGPDDAWLLFWNDPPIGVFEVPCAGVKSPPAASLADLADAVAAMPGTDLVEGPTDVTVGGYPAKHVVFTIRDDIGCPPDTFDLWYGVGGSGNARYASATGSTIRVWAIDVNGSIVWIDGETYKGAGAKLGVEIQQIIDSIQFE